MSLKTTKILYWITTGLLALFILPGIFFLTSPFAIEGTAKLGIPYWFHIEVGVAQFLAGLVLIIPRLPKVLKEWAYFGIGVVYLSAMIAHLSVDGVVGMSFAPLLNFAFVAISYVCYHKLENAKG